MGWLKDEFARARERQSKLPPHARIQWVEPSRPMTDGEAWDEWRDKIDHPAYGEG